MTENLPSPMQSFKGIDELTKGIDKSVGEAAAPTDALFTGRMQLVQPMSKVLNSKDAKGKCSAGDFVFGPPGFHNFGIETYIIPIAKRAHALRLDGKDAVIGESFDCPAKGSPPTNKQQEVFSSIMGSPKSRKENNKKVETNMWGNDILFYSPLIGKWMNYFFHSTARPASEDAFNLRGTVAHLTQSFVETSQGSWYTPHVSGVEMTIIAEHKNDDGSGEMKVSVDGKELRLSFPSPAATKEEIQKFFNPKPQGEETTTDSGRVR